MMFNVINTDFGVNKDFDKLPELIDHILYLCPSGNYFVYLDNILFAKIENYTDYEYNMILYLDSGMGAVPYYRLINKPY